MANPLNLAEILVPILNFLLETLYLFNVICISKLHGQKYIYEVFQGKIFCIRDACASKGFLSKLFAFFQKQVFRNGNNVKEVIQEIQKIIYRLNVIFYHSNFLF